MSKWRMAQVKNNNKWEMKSFGELKRGDIFRLFEPDGVPVADGKIYIADNNPEPFEPPVGNMKIDCTPWE